MTTPENITGLKENEVFVFGSNLAGHHAGGAARLAKEKFGAEEGVGEGMTGQCYAFPTLNEKFERLLGDRIRESADRLIETAKAHPDKTFLLTKVGCGIAAYPESFMSQFFKDVPENIIKPTNW